MRIVLTTLAEKQVATLTGSHRKALFTFLADLRTRGSAALSYRLMGDDLVDRICVRHLRDTMRAVVVFEDADTAWLLMVGPHVDDPDSDVYTALWKACGLATPPIGRRRKPACCQDDGVAPLAGDADVVTDLVARCTDLARSTRSARRRSSAAGSSPS